LRLPALERPLSPASASPLSARLRLGGGHQLVPDRGRRHGRTARAQSIWDDFCRQPGAIADGSDGRVACDHYHRLDEDLDLIAGLGVDAYRFSVSWPRVQPDGQGAWNDAGLAFYDRLVDGLLARGMQPYLTLNHWDLPSALQAQGGWAARETVQRFVDYACTMGRRWATAWRPSPRTTSPG
jgi:beta-glucosidase/6-phospho-beta-glucosidase/beta-galactosidase